MTGIVKEHHEAVLLSTNRGYEFEAVSTKSRLGEIQVPFSQPGSMDHSCSITH